MKQRRQTLVNLLHKETHHLFDHFIISICAEVYSCFKKHLNTFLLLLLNWFNFGYTVATDLYWFWCRYLWLLPMRSYYWTPNWKQCLNVTNCFQSVTQFTNKFLSPIATALHKDNTIVSTKYFNIVDLSCTDI